MTKQSNFPERLVFGLDIGTRSIVGTVGFLERDRFQVIAQRSREHDTRSMLDGQIHDIGRVSENISLVKAELEEVIGRKLSDVCIAAAGRVLRTVSIHIEQEYEQEREVSKEDIFTLDSMGIEKAYDQFAKENDTDLRFYCVGYSVVRYYLNNYPIGNLENHKAKVVAADLIATFLPDDVVDGLNKSVELSGLQVANLTLEPIAAIQVAIPEMYRMLNIALVDVGAGTSDISITKDGSITAYGMIPIAGDVLTETIARQCLVDFQTAEQMKRDACEKDVIEYKDIMLLPQKITKEELCKILEPVLSDMTRQVADKIKELNGDKSVSAVFVVGGGGKVPGYTQMLAKELEIQPERVALRGEEVMQKVDFLEKDVKKDSLLVTPVGICLTYYLRANSFIFVNFNGVRIKLYDNAKLAVVDAAMHVGFPNDALFPKRGKELNITVGGKARIIRGLPGEAAEITVNGEPADINTAIKANDSIVVKKSTAGEDAHMEIRMLPEYNSALSVNINGQRVDLPKFATVNGGLQSGYYEIQDGDDIQMLNYYTVKQILEFMDVQIDRDRLLLVNNVKADMDTRVYENFSVAWTLSEEQIRAYEESLQYAAQEAEDIEEVNEDEDYDEAVLNEASGEDFAEADIFFEDDAEEAANIKDDAPAGHPVTDKPESNHTEIQVIANGMPVLMTGKKDYIFVDIFDYISFDLSTPHGSGVETKLNGQYAQYMDLLKSGDVLEIYWKQD
ncbi:MAG: cell division protein FtsA [Clostridiales bacterium]|nr:cell division protein FtsA [Clostridiales bacterium]